MISTKQINDLSNPANGWFHVEKSGDHEVDYGEGPAVLRIDEQAIKSMVDEFNSRTFDGPGMLIDGDHLSHDLSRDTRALGWLKRLDTYRDPSGALELYGFIEWTPRGQQMLADKEYTQSSTEYGEGMTFNDGIYHPSRLAGFALTNRPRIKGKRPLVNRQTSPASTEAGGDQQSPEQGENNPETNMENDDREYPSKEMDKAQRALFDSMLDKLDVEFDGTDDMSRDILGRLDELLSLEKREKDHVNAEVDDAVSTYENELDEEERKEFTEERREELKNSLRESPAALGAFVKALNRSAKSKPPHDVVDESRRNPAGRTSLNRRATQAPPNPFRKKESIDGFQNRVDELMKGGMKRYDAFQKATEEGYIVTSER